MCNGINYNIISTRFKGDGNRPIQSKRRAISIEGRIIIVFNLLKNIQFLKVFPYYVLYFLTTFCFILLSYSTRARGEYALHYRNTFRVQESRMSVTLLLLLSLCMFLRYYFRIETIIFARTYCKHMH